jgi:hypothetical protein
MALRMGAWRLELRREAAMMVVLRRTVGIGALPVRRRVPLAMELTWILTWVLTVCLSRVLAVSLSRVLLAVGLSVGLSVRLTV